MISQAEIGNREKYFGKNCPEGMVQVEFVGCDPKTRYSDYGYKPSKSAFIEIYVDGVRFRIDIGDVYNGRGSRKVRGIHVNGPIDLQVEKTAMNAVSVFIKPEEVEPSDDHSTSA